MPLPSRLVARGQSAAVVGTRNEACACARLHICSSLVPATLSNNVFCPTKPGFLGTPRPMESLSRWPCSTSMLASLVLSIARYSFGACTAVTSHKCECSYKIVTNSFCGSDAKRMQIMPIVGATCARLREKRSP